MSDTPSGAGLPSVLLLGVAHVLNLKESLTIALKEFGPKAIAIELDYDRLNSLMMKAPGLDPGVANGTPLILRILSRTQERLATELGDIPGSEMLVAMEVARDIDLPLFMIDDPIRVVAHRLLSALSPRERVRFILSSLLALFIPARLVKRELGHYSEDREAFVAELRKQFPNLARVLLNERDIHMAERLKGLAHNYGRVAAVIGDAHSVGVESILKETADVTVKHLLT